jgi:hypothetical protein
MALLVCDTLHQLRGFPRRDGQESDSLLGVGWPLVADLPGACCCVRYQVKSGRQMAKA